MRQPLHLVCGPPGSGKSTYGSHLARFHGAAFFDSDTASAPLVRAGLIGMGLSPDDRDSSLYKATFREAVYENLFALAEANLDHLPVIIAGPFTRESGDATWLTQLERRFGTTVTVHFVYIAPETRRLRMMQRGEPRDAAKLAGWSNYLASCREEPPPFRHVFVDGGFPAMDRSLAATAQQRDNPEEAQQSG